MRGEYVSRNITLERKRMRRSSSSAARTYLLKAASRSWMKCRSSDILTNKEQTISLGLYFQAIWCQNWRFALATGVKMR
jgi:hypothetical protein